MLPLFILIAVGSCCPSAKRQQPAYWDLGEKYYLQLKSVTRATPGNVRDLAISEAPRFEWTTQDEIGAFQIGSTTHQFYFDIKNLGTAPLSVLWDKGYYVGEGSRRFPLGHRPADESSKVPSGKTETTGETRSTSIPAAAVIRETVFVPDKIYKVRSSCFVDYVFNEPLIPETLNGHTIESLRETARTLRENGKSVAVVLPVRLADKTYQYEFRFVLGDNPNAPP